MLGRNGRQDWHELPYHLVSTQSKNICTYRAGPGGGIDALWRDNKIRVALSLCEKNGAFLFQVLPDVFPQGRLTEVEISLWDKYYKDREDAKKR